MNPSGSGGSTGSGSPPETINTPDFDAIKMFVGQVPKSWNENDIRDYFKEFGSIYLVNVLRDKITKQSRGCCFITYYKRKSALDAQNACHNLKTLPGMNHPIQMKPADNENRAERKIFVGMLNKKIHELDLRRMFSRFGLIEECSILRDTNSGQSRGCGFVTFSSKACALSAIKAMHHSITMDGCSSPLVVKFADVQRDNSKMMAKDAIALLTSLAESNNVLAQKSQYLPVLHLLTQPNLLPPAQQAAASANPPFGSFPNLNPLNPGGGGALGPSLSAQTSAESATLSFLANLATSGQASATQYSFPAQVEGPDGSNLFIYHLPQEFTDTDMVQAFQPFGNILSAKVFIDKTTNLSKCFGFVSYDNAFSAHLAISAMNGFQIGPKRLKVQLKRAKDKPY